MSDLLVIVPTRSRRAQCERLLKSFTETADDADILFVTDGDDQETYADMDWGPADHAVLDPRDSLSGKLNRTADAVIDAYDALFFVGDDHVFRTDHWDTVMLSVLEKMNGTGWLYPDDKRRSDVPEIWMTSSNVIQALGWFAPPEVRHYYCDNIIAELGNRSGLIRRVPEVIIEHLHYAVCADTERDQLYQETESAWGASDAMAFRQWRITKMPQQAALLRREFSPDVEWVLGKI